MSIGDVTRRVDAQAEQDRVFARVAVLNVCLDALRKKTGRTLVSVDDYRRFEHIARLVERIGTPLGPDDMTQSTLARGPDLDALQKALDDTRQDGNEGQGGYPSAAPQYTPEPVPVPRRDR